jgi:hypothetical protein
MLAESQKDPTWARGHWHKKAAGTLPGTGRSNYSDYLMKVWIQSFAK